MNARRERQLAALRILARAALRKRKDPPAAKGRKARGEVL